MVYTVIVLEPAARVLATIRERKTALRLLGAIDGLADEPRPRGAVKLKARHDQYRIRVGDWRIIYTIEDDQLLVVVVLLGQRKDVYR